MINDIPSYKFNKSKDEYFKSTNIDDLCTNNLRVISAAMVSHANSGHPGAPMGCAPIVHSLYSRIMKFAPEHRDWIARDRFVMSNGHCCALLYSILSMFGYYTIDELKQFRQINSVTPGHPERNVERGIEVTTGPLGQGVAQAVGLAIANKHAAAKFPSLFTNAIYCLCGDGCLNEGVALEAIALAGNLKLNNLVLLYDRNGITIDGPTSIAFNEDIAKLFKAYHWDVKYVQDGNTDHTAIEKAILEAKRSNDKPTIVIVDTTIGFGSEFEGTHKVHGAPLVEKDLTRLREKIGIKSDDLFNIDPVVNEFYQKRAEQLKNEYIEWTKKLNELSAEDRKQFDSFVKGIDRNELAKFVLNESTKLKEDSGRGSSQSILKLIATKTDQLIGGSADLKESNKTDVINEVNGSFSGTNPKGRYIHYGIREHAMIAISNGLAAWRNMLPFCATFLNFYSYGAGAMKLGAQSHLPVLYIATHDSIELGEDGPTHQPIEVVPMLRATPNIDCIRPSDAKEVAGAYASWLKNSTGPTAIALSRGKLPLNPYTDANKALLGAYPIIDFNNNGKKQVILAAAGSELHIAIETAELLTNYDVRVVSYPSSCLFSKQDKKYQRSVFPENIPAGIMEPYSSLGIHKFFCECISITLDRYGLSGPAKKVYEELGFTAQNWANKIKANI